VVEALELEDSAECAGESTRTTFRRATRALTLGHDDFASAHDDNRPVVFNGFTASAGHDDGYYVV
jgi:hypothetical protein